MPNPAKVTADDELNAAIVLFQDILSTRRMELDSILIANPKPSDELTKMLLSLEHLIRDGSNALIAGREIFKELSHKPRSSAVEDEKRILASYLTVAAKVVHAPVKENVTRLANAVEGIKGISAGWTKFKAALLIVTGAALALISAFATSAGFATIMTGVGAAAFVAGVGGMYVATKMLTKGSSMYSRADKEAGPPAFIDPKMLNKINSSLKVLSKTADETLKAQGVMDKKEENKNFRSR